MLLKSTFMVALCAIMTSLSCYTVLGSLSIASGDQPIANIVGGQQRDIERAPWMVTLFKRTYFDEQKSLFVLTRLCAGSILSNNVIVTAQHCVPPDSANVAYFISSGLSDISSVNVDTPLIKVAKIVRYPRFVAPQYGKDVALLFLESSLIFSSKQSAIGLCNPRLAQRMEKQFTNGFIAGWGASVDGGPLSEKLKIAAVRIQNNNALLKSAGPLTPDQITAGQGGKAVANSCDGDSGGSLIVLSKTKPIKPFLVGVTSWGVSCKGKSRPWVYARVSHFSNWITRIIEADKVDAATMVVQAYPFTVVGNGELVSIPIIVPRNLKAVHFQLQYGTGNVGLGVRFLNQIGQPDCQSGPDMRCSFYYPFEGVYTVVLTGMAPSGGYVRVDALYEVFDNATELFKIVYPNVKLAKGTIHDWGGLQVLPGGIVSINITRSVAPIDGADFGEVTFPRANLGVAVDEGTPNLCASGETQCVRSLPTRGATSLSFRIEGDELVDTIYNVELGLTRVKGNYKLTVLPFVEFTSQQTFKTFTFTGLVPGTEFGIRIHLLSGIDLDVSMYFGVKQAQVLQANGKVLAGRTLYLSVIVPEYSDIALINCLGLNAKFFILSVVG